jgi:hypothetical protein
MTTTPQEKYERSLDGGKTWQEVPFRAVRDLISHHRNPDAALDRLFDGTPIDVAGTKFRCVEPEGEVSHGR